jgi:hypothetical protein
MPFNHIVLLFLLLTSQVGHCAAQSFYKDSTKLLSFNYLGHEGMDYYPPNLQTESIYLDSTVDGKRYYKYQWSSKYGFKHELQLRLEDKRVYLSGEYKYKIEKDFKGVDTFTLLNDYLLYDFNLEVGDTFWFKDPFGYGIDPHFGTGRFPCYGNDSFYVITKTEVVFDQITGDSFLTQECYRYGSGTIITSSQYGSSIGFMSHLYLIEANLTKYFCQYISPLICCINSDLIFENVSKSYNGYLTKYFNGNLCDSANIADGYQVFLNADDETRDYQVQIKPNPVSDILTIESNEVFQLRILNSNGEFVFDLNGVNEIDLSALAPGVYYVWLSNKEQSLFRKVLKL